MIITLARARRESACCVEHGPRPLRARTRGEGPEDSAGHARRDLRDVRCGRSSGRSLPRALLRPRSRGKGSPAEQSESAQRVLRMDQTPMRGLELVPPRTLRSSFEDSLVQRGASHDGEAEALCAADAATSCRPSA